MRPQVVEAGGDEIEQRSESLGILVAQRFHDCLVPGRVLSRSRHGDQHTCDAGSVPTDVLAQLSERGLSIKIVGCTYGGQRQLVEASSINGRTAF